MSEYEPITGEMREWWVIKFPVMDEEKRRDFTTICDRIDAVNACLERENAELRERLAALDESADSMHGGWVMDADGVPICVGDVLTDDAEFKSEGKVVRLMLEDGGWMVGIGDGGWSTPSLHEWHHHHAPTVEDVLREFGDWYAHTKGGCDEDGIIAEYAAKLRLAGDAE